MNPIHIIFLIASLLSIGGMAATEYVIGNTENTAGQETIILQDNKTGFEKVIQDNVIDVNNSVTNMLNERESPDTTMKLIRYEYRRSLRDSTYSAEEIEYNILYQNYLNAAYDVAKAKIENPKSITDKVKEMNKAYKELF